MFLFVQEPHRHRHGHSKYCKVCNLLENSDFAISTTEDHPKTYTKVHVCYIDYLFEK